MLNVLSLTPKIVLKLSCQYAQKYHTTEATKFEMHETQKVKKKKSRN